MTIKLDGSALSFDNLSAFLDGANVAVSKKAASRINKVRAFVEERLSSDIAYYGINTGFGNMANTRIGYEKLDKVQENLIVSHAVGVGKPFSLNLSKLMMLLRANVLAAGYSGIRLETLEFLINLINRNMIAVIPSQGSVGASGDLAPLSHIALTLMGKGEMFYNGLIMPSAEVFAQERITPITLKAKEGIALINGTQAMTALAAFAHIRAKNLIKAADIIGALSVEGDLASIVPFDKRIHALRPHPGQKVTASNLKRMLEGSEIIKSHKNCGRVQDPYSFRCMPQVHGAVKDAVAYSRSVIERELGSCTDNPLIFESDGDILSGGNFHGEPVAIAMDTFAIAIAELGSISERRVAILNTPLEGEIAARSLVKNSGLNSGLLPAHVTMSSLVSENKGICHPASVDSIPTFGGQEDHVSMGTTAARKALRVLENVERILSIELFAACQAIDLQKGRGHSGRGTSVIYDLVRQIVPSIDSDREYRKDMDECFELLRSGTLVAAAEDAVSELNL